MKPRYRLSRDAVELIKSFEGFRPKAARLESGGWTIGYGHTKTARQGVVIDRDDAEALLLYDLIDASHAVNDQVFTPLNANQFDALVAFAFSIGVKNFASSAVLRRLNEGRMLEAAYAMEMWRKAKVGGEVILVDALVRRRAAEKALFLTPPEGLAPTPSSVLRPQLDYEVISPAPRDGAQTPASEAAPAPLAQSASETAAVALHAQLESLLPDEEPSAQAPALEISDEELPLGEAELVVMEADVAPLEVVESAAQAAPEIEAVPFIQSTSSEEDLPPGPFTATPAPSRDAEVKASAVAAADRLEAELGRRRSHMPVEFGLSRTDTLSILMLLGGMILFLLGLAVGTHASAGQAPLGWIAGVIGVAIACIGFYRLLQRLLEEGGAA